jgi:hypothetical protein
VEGIVVILFAVVIIINNLLVGGAVWLIASARGKSAAAEEAKKREPLEKKLAAETERNSMLDVQLSATKKELLYARQTIDMMQKEMEGLRSKARAAPQGAEKAPDKGAP